MRSGSGIQNKVLEAMACGAPVVATAIANRGVQGVPDRDLLVADTAETVAAAVLRLLDEPALGARLAQAGRAFVEQQFRWESHAARLAAIYAAQQPPARRSVMSTHDETAALRDLAGRLLAEGQGGPGAKGTPYNSCPARCRPSRRSPCRRGSRVIGSAVHQIADLFGGMGPWPGIAAARPGRSCSTRPRRWPRWSRSTSKR